MMKTILLQCTVACLFLSIIPTTLSAIGKGPMQNPPIGNSDDGGGGGCPNLYIPPSLDLFVQGEPSLGFFDFQDYAMPDMHLAIYRVHASSDPYDLSSMQQLFLSEAISVFQASNEFCGNDRIYSYNVDLSAAGLAGLRPECPERQIQLVYALVTGAQTQWDLYPIGDFEEHFTCLLPDIDGNPWITDASLIVTQTLCCREGVVVDPRDPVDPSDPNYPGDQNRRSTPTEDAVVEYKATISPNPMREEFRIETNFSEIIKMQVVNLNGETIFETNQYQPTIDASSWPPGMYIVHINRLDATITRKVLKL